MLSERAGGRLEPLPPPGPHHQEGPPAVGDHAAVEAMQRIGDHRRADHVLDGDDLAQQRVRVVLRVMRGGDLDPRQLLARGAELVHVAHRHHAITVDRGKGVRRVPRRFRRHGRQHGVYEDADLRREKAPLGIDGVKMKFLWAILGQ